MCLRLTQGLLANNPGRFQLLKLAKDFHWRARELEQAEAGHAADSAD